MTDVNAETLQRYAALVASGATAPRRALAEELGVPESTIKSRLERARAARLREKRDRMGELDPTVQERLKSRGFETTAGLHSGWVIDRETDADGKRTGAGESLYFFLGREKPVTLEEAMDIIVERISEVPALPPVPEPVFVADDALAAYLGSDLHFGAKGYGEAAALYNREIALKRLRRFTMRSHALLPAARKAVIVWNGDTFHANDHKNRTPKSGHTLINEGTPLENLGLMVTAISWQISLALQKHGEVEVAILKGNHDPDIVAGLIRALQQRYRAEPRVKVWISEDRFFVLREGALFAAFHHGDGLKPKQLAEGIPYRFRKEWAGAERFYLYTGHEHNEHSATFGSLQWSRLPCACGLEGFAADYGFTDTSGMEAAAFDLRSGERPIRITVNG